ASEDRVNFVSNPTPAQQKLRNHLEPSYSTRYPACFINFQLDTETDTSSFKHYEVARVRSVNECARICFVGRCAVAVYSPLGGECRLGVDSRDSCSNDPSTTYYDGHEDVILQCFRCGSPKNFLKKLAHKEETKSKAVVISHQEDKVDNTVHEDQTTLPSTTPMETNKNCLIKFQARPFSDRPPETNASLEIEFLVDSAEMCAFRCYQDGCSGAKYDPTASSCALSYNDKPFCTEEDMVLQYKTDQVTWLNCVNCYKTTTTNGTADALLGSASQESPLTETEASTIDSLSKVKHRPINNENKFQEGNRVSLVCVSETEIMQIPKTDFDNSMFYFNEQTRG
uniref:Apple domain-containing protein n=1 Tax=Angiostrongylus cantonensis TaxID=6313 RepID=A0A0K0DGI4_ANGCA